MAYFDCQIVQGGGGIILTVECNQVFAGAAITATDGVTTLSQTCPSSSPYEVQFHIPNVGTWTISGTYAGDSYSTQVVIPSSATLTPVPNGSTATPTDVIQTWLHCADIWDKNYTTISQVLADGATVTALIASNNAADYMARSTSWANSVTANASAMTKIGANNYCANKLLANSTWRTAICNSTYFESVLNVKVPTMTSNTTPSGVASGNGVFQNYQPYLAFDKDETGSSAYIYPHIPPQNSDYVGYDFGRNVKIYKVRVLTGSFGSGQLIVKGSSDGNTWSDLKTFDRSTGYDFSAILAPSSAYRYYRAQPYNATTAGAGYYMSCVEFQMYGRSE